MSSREIAELTGKRHADVMRDIRVILADVEINERKFASVYIDAKGEQPPCFNLPKRETMVLVSGYSVVLRARIVDRWAGISACCHCDGCAGLSAAPHACFCAGVYTLTEQAPKPTPVST